MEAGPGLSLFQGSDSIQLNAAAQRLEEDEEQEDKKRRDEEVRRISVSFNAKTINVQRCALSFVSFRDTCREISLWKLSSS